MKKSILLLASLVFAAASTKASAFTLYITGSSAFRGQVDAALKSGTFGYTSQGWTKGANSGKANNAVYVNGSNKIIAHWSGSVGGIQAVAQNRTDVPYLVPTYTGTGDATLNPDTDAADTGHIADFAFTDVYQSASPYPTPLLTSDIVGINAFRVVANYVSGGNPVTHLNYQQARALWSAGKMDLSQITGLNSDKGKTIYAMGRDPDSGTRLTFFAETGIGALSVVNQYTATTTTSTAITQVDLVPASTVYGVGFGIGNGGYSSGGTLAGVLRLDASAAHVGSGSAGQAYFVSYLSRGDSDTAIGADGTVTGSGNASLVQFENSDVAANVYPTQTTGNDHNNLAFEIQNGSHPFWSYEHAIHGASISSNAQTVYTALVNYMQDYHNTSGNSNATATGTGTANGIYAADGGVTSYGTMNVYRSSDGGTILSTN